MGKIVNLNENPLHKLSARCYTIEQALANHGQAIGELTRIANLQAIVIERIAMKLGVDVKTILEEIQNESQNVTKEPKDEKKD